MRFFSFMAALAMVAFCVYAIWDLKLSDMANPPLPRTALTEPDPAVSAAMAPHREALKTRMSSAVIPAIDETLSTLEAQYGAGSAQMAQAASEAAIMLAEQGRNDLAIGYMQHAEQAARDAYGPRHRETAVIQHDLANLRIAASRTGYDEQADTLLREAIATRRGLLGDAASETRGAELTLADMLYTRWINEAGEPDSPLLEEAAGLLAHPFEAGEPGSMMAAQARAARMLQGRIAFAREHYEEAADAYAETLPAPRDISARQVYGMLGTVYQEQVIALRKAGREEEANALLVALNESLKSMAAEAADTGQVQ